MVHFGLPSPKVAMFYELLEGLPHAIAAEEAAAVAGASLGDLSKLVDRSWLHVGADGHFAVRNVARRKLRMLSWTW